MDLINLALVQKIAKIPQSDWNQNDSTAADYVKNRPFYAGEFVETELFDVCALADAANIPWTQLDEGIYGCMSDFDNNNIIFIEAPPEIGSECIVKYNGLSNNFIAQDGTAFEFQDGIIIGDADGFNSGNLTQVFMLIYPYYLFDESDVSGKYMLAGAVVPSDTAPTELKVTAIQQEIKKIDPKFETDPTVPAWAKKKNKPTYTADEVGAMSKTNPVGTGSFSMGRKSGTTIGDRSHAEGYNTTASGQYSHAEGYNTTASGDFSHAEGGSKTASGRYSHAEGYNTTASGDFSHAEGGSKTASGQYSHAEGYNTTASGDFSHAEGYATKAYVSQSHAEGGGTTASGPQSHAEGYYTTASGPQSHAEGYYTTAQRRSQHVQGEYNVLDTVGSAKNRGKYAHIVGNGTSESARSNAHTLDWDGNAWYAGTIEGTALIIKSSTEGSTKRFKITVDDTGTLTATEVT